MLAAALLLGPSLGSPAAAQSAERDRTATGKLDPARIDLLKPDGFKQAAQADPRKLDRRSANSWAVLGVVEAAGGNFAGAKASFERAMALGERRRNKVAAATAALVLARVHAAGFTFKRVDVKTAAGIRATMGTLPSDEPLAAVRTEFEGARAATYRAIALYAASGRKDGIAVGYTDLGKLYSTNEDYDQARATLGEALALNTALQNKPGMAGNYRQLADTYKYNPDRAGALLKEAAALDEALGLKAQLATDYEMLGNIHKTRGDPFEAEQFYKRALALAPSRREQSHLLSILERLYKDLDSLGQAAEMKERAVALDTKDGRGLLRFDPDLGLYLSGHTAQEQMEALEKAVPMEKAIGHPVGLATSFMLLGMHYARRAEIDETTRAEFEARAEAMLIDALALNRSLGRDAAVAHVCSDLAPLRDRRGNLDGVEEALKCAQELANKLKDDRSMRHLYFSLGFGRQRRGDTAQACVYWRKGILAYPDDQQLAGLLKNNKCADAP